MELLSTWAGFPITVDYKKHNHCRIMALLTFYTLVFHSQMLHCGYSSKLMAHKNKQMTVVIMSTSTTINETEKPLSTPISQQQNGGKLYGPFLQGEI